MYASAYADIIDSAETFEAPYKDVCIGKEESSLVGISFASPYTDPVEEKTKFLILFFTNCSKIRWVTIIFWLISLCLCFNPYLTSAFAAKWKTISAFLKKLSIFCFNKSTL